MMYKKAEQICQILQELLGKLSTLNSTSISNVFITVMSEHVRDIQLREWGRGFEFNFKDEGDFTIYFEFFDKKILPAKSVIVEDNCDDYCF